MSQAKMLEGVSESDIKRFAICWLTSDRSNTNWEAAAEAYDPSHKVASFKTVTGKAANKVNKGETTNGAGAEGEESNAPARPNKTPASGKRKAKGEDGSASSNKKAKVSAKGKKSKSEDRVADKSDDDAEDDCGDMV